MMRAHPDEWYALDRKGDGVTLISEPWIKEFYRCNMWHIRGRDRDLLVDRGMGVVPLRRWVPLVTEKALLAVASHTHFDRIGCVVLAEALDRLSRSQADISGLHERLRFLGVTIKTRAEGAISELHIGLKGTMNALFLKDLAQKTHRGLEGRVREGKSAGGGSRASR
jgi:glyoxylase-like metal-dependent hydrolase (beta-lactamase superfamily II)